MMISQARVSNNITKTYVHDMVQLRSQRTEGALRSPNRPKKKLPRAQQKCGMSGQVLQFFLKACVSLRPGANFKKIIFKSEHMSAKAVRF